VGYNWVAKSNKTRQSFKKRSIFLQGKEFFMRKFILIVFLLSLFFACNSRATEEYTLDKLKDEFKETFDIYEIPIGTYFWDEFNAIEVQYKLTKNESKLLGEWMNVSFINLVNNYYSFFPNKFFLLTYKFENYRIIDAEEMYFYKAIGTWEIIDDIVKITIYAIITEDLTREYPHNKDILYVEHPYTVDFININDIDEEGFTRRPINDTILSDELKKMVTIKEPNKTNNLYVRNVYIINFMTNSGQPEKNYGYFRYFPEMARENHSGLDIVMDPELIKRYIPDWMY
jgi:hypothetical protein